MTMRTLSVAIALSLWAAPAIAMPDPPAPAFEQVKGVAGDGTRFYEDSLVIEAPSARLWAAFTDIAVYRLWAVPVSAIDFRLGGAIEASYDPKGHIGDPQNIRNAFIAYIPGRLLVFQNVQAPDGLPGKGDYGKTVKTVEFESLGPNRTRVTVSGIGFADGKGFDQLYAFFSQGDGQMLVSLKKAMET
jgi:uncharacterized protein YndB with AHSA1/START domain